MHVLDSRCAIVVMNVFVVLLSRCLTTAESGVKVWRWLKCIELFPVAWAAVRFMAAALLLLINCLMLLPLVCGGSVFVFVLLYIT